jgi:DNA-binding transcriptional LysR family regulator
MDWDDLRFYLAVIRHKSLVGAAKQLQVTQSTVGRRLAALEERLGVRLVHRTQEGCVPTLAGEAIRQHVERVEAEMHSVERAVSGLDARLAGIVRVASTPLLAGHVLAPCAAALYNRYPEISLELIANSTAPDLARREADVSVQLSRCEEGGMVVRRIGTLAFGLYASLAYLSRHGDPDPKAGCDGHHLVVMVDERELPAQAEWLAEVAGRAQVLLRTNSRETLFWAALQAGGLALLPCFRGDQEPALQRVETVPPPPSAEVWLVVHEEMRRVPRVRAVLDCVAESFHRIASTMDPRAPTQDR